MLIELMALAYVMFCAIWYHLYNLKNMKNTHGGVLHLVKLQAFRISGPIVEVKKSALINDYENIIACSEESEQSKV